MPATAAACERNWSVWAHIWSRKRNLLKPDRVAKLVYVYFNRRALIRYNTVPTATEWEELVQYMEEMDDAEAEVVTPRAAAALVGDGGVEMLVAAGSGGSGGAAHGVGSSASPLLS